MAAIRDKSNFFIIKFSFSGANIGDLAFFRKFCSSFYLFVKIILTFKRPKEIPKHFTTQ
jgi:hypothetical protein